MTPDQNRLYAILKSAKTIAVVGASSDPGKPSHSIMKILQNAGYKTIPVNPNETSVLGEHAYPSLKDIPVPVDIVNVFRRPEATPLIAQDAIDTGAKTLWLQLGISNDEAAAIAEKGELDVVMNNCIAVTHRILGIPPVR